MSLQLFHSFIRESMPNEKGSFASPAIGEGSNVLKSDENQKFHNDFK